MNNKGFTAIEILLSFVLVMFIVLNLFTIVNTHRKQSELAMHKSELTNFQNILTKDIYSDFLTKGVESVVTCTDEDACVEIKYFNETNPVKLIVDTSNLREKTITYNNRIYDIRDYIPPQDKLPQGSDPALFQTVVVSVTNETILEAFDSGLDFELYKIKIGIRHVDLKENFDIEVISSPNTRN